ncbi:MAG: putative NTPase family [Bradyrhizobium sp.]|nr:putative NTPase family [Bradyrhizobium sp.]
MADATAEQLLAILGEMAVRLHVEERMVGKVAELEIDWVKERWTTDPARIPAPLVATRLVWIDDGEIMFIHRSFHEFMVARRLYQDPKRLLEALDLSGFAAAEILHFAAGLSDQVAPLVETRA